MVRTIDLDAAIDVLKDMYRVAETWGKEADNDITKARAESRMASLIEMKLRIEKLTSVQPEPKTPIYYGDGYADGQMVYDMAECPKCGYTYDEGVGVWGEPFCPHCGQALDWSVEEQNE